MDRAKPTEKQHSEYSRSVLQVHGESLAVILPELTLPEGKAILRVGNEIVFYTNAELEFFIDLKGAVTYRISFLMKGTQCKNLGPEYEIVINKASMGRFRAPLGGERKEFDVLLNAGQNSIVISYPEDCFVSTIEDGNLVVSEIYIEKMK